MPSHAALTATATFSLAAIVCASAERLMASEAQDARLPHRQSLIIGLLHSSPGQKALHHECCQRRNFAQKWSILTSAQS